MGPSDKQRPAKQDETGAPIIEEQDWDVLGGSRIPPVTINGDLQDPAEGELAEEDDDNPFQDSDEALPDDEEERVLSKDPSKEGSRFDEV